MSVTDRPIRPLLERLPVLLLVAGLPLFHSLGLTIDPLDPKTALWGLAGGWALAFPTTVTTFSAPSLILLLAAFTLLTTPFRSIDAVFPWLIGAACWWRGRSLAFQPGFLRRYARLTLIVATLVALYGFWQAIVNRLDTGVTLVNPFGQRVLSTLGNPTFLADYLALQLPFALAACRAAATGGGFAAASGSAALIAVVLVLTGSKGGQLAGVLVTAIWMVETLRHRAMARGRVAGLALLLVVLGFLAAAGGTSPRQAVARWIAGSDRFSFSQRAEILRGAAALIRTAPLLGHGAGTFPTLFPVHQPGDLQRSLGITLTVNHAHDDYAEIAGDLGLIGLGLWLLILAGGLLPRPRTAAAAPLRLSLLAGACTLGTNFGLFVPSTAFFIWFHAGLLDGDRHAGDAPEILPPARRSLPILAIAMLAAVLGIRGLLGSAWYAAGAGALDHGQAALAKPLLQQAAMALPEERHVFQYLGRAHEQTGDTAGAVEPYERAWRLGPFYPITLLNLARIHRQLWLDSRQPADRDATIVFSRSALGLNPYQIEPRLWAADLLLEARRPGEAGPFLEGLPDGVAPTPAWHQVRARWLDATGQHTAASAERAAAADLDLARQLADADLALQQGRGTDAERLVRAVLKARPKWPQAWESLGYVLHGQGRLEDSYAAYRKLCALAPANLAGPLNAATLALQLGRLPDARRWVDLAEHLAPDEIDVHLARARLARAQGDRRLSAIEYRWILDRQPNHAQAVAELASLQNR